MDFRRRHIFLARTYTAVPKRTLRKHLRACGAVVVRHSTRGRDGRSKIPIDTIVVGNGLEGHESQVIPGWAGDVHYWNEAQVIHALGINDTPNERLTRLRDLMAGAMTPARWYRVCCCLEVWPDGHGLQMAIDYVDQHADELPGQLRTALPCWLTRAAARTEEPRLRVVRHVDLLGRRLECGRLRGLLSSPHLDKVTTLNLSGNQPDDKTWALVTRDPRFSQLEVLILDRCWIASRAVELLLTSQTFGNLKSLSLRSLRISEDDRNRLHKRWRRSAEVITV